MVTKNMNTTREIYKPASDFVLGAIRTPVERWEISGRRVYVVYKDGRVMHSEYTPSEVREGGFAVRA
jgi:hypothetical protein